MRGYAAIGLKDVKIPHNVGSALRAAHCYGASFVAVSGSRFKRLHSATDVTKAWRHLPVVEVADIFDATPYDCVPVAVELLPQARSLIDYTHPPRAFYIFGAEDQTLGVATLSRCRDVIYVPTAWCMNLAATVNVILYDRLAKHEAKSRNT